MITLALAAIIMGLAVPSFDKMVRDGRQVSQVNDLVGAFNIARSEAVNRNAPVTVCQSADGENCSGTWQQGWIIFVDGNGDGIVADTDVAVDNNDDGAINKQDAIVRAYDASSAGTTLTDNGTAAVTFNSRGQSPAASGQFLFCDKGGDADAVAVLIGPTGRVSSAHKTDGATTNPAVTVSCP